ncbi:hypothetical protein CU097_007900 [Rhizopus azygosporus]|uniref:Uncharacterized protein n=1 Tax=Rhizopus azygosporus TaxID=86630 RepID=A0A367J3X0_RHIAZ|nr:hypothetical protein CU097_007900 [Rhizopus azygosporus]
MDGTRTRSRSLFVMKHEYIEHIIENIVSILPRLQTHIKMRKENNRTIIGYTRKTPSNDSQEHRTMLLQRVVDCLVSRTLADCVFVSTSSFASDLLSERDKNYSKVTYLRDRQGNTLDFLNYISKVQKFCLDITDFAGFSTNVRDIERFARTNKNLVETIVDNLPYKSEVTILTTNNQQSFDT